MPVEDLRRDLQGCVVMHKNKPVYVTNIGRDGTVYFRDLLSQREASAPFTLEGFSNPLRRVGYVNVMGSCLYVTRDPLRKFFMGLHPNNLNIKAIPGLDYPQGAQHTKMRVQSMCIPELGDAIMNKYPTLAQAIKRAKDTGGACAFDKQFAVSNGRYVFYKGTVVGRVASTAKAAADIQWEQGKEYLSILLDNNHEKTVRDFRPAA